MAALLLSGLQVPVWGMQPEESGLDERFYQEQLEAAGAQELWEEMPQDAQHFFGQAGITELDYTSLLSLTPEEFLKIVADLAGEKIRQPLAVCFSVLGIILLCALLEGMKTAMWEGTLSTVFSTVAITCTVGAMVSPVIGCITATAQALAECSDFIVGFIPVFTSVVIAGGQPVTAGTYTTFLFMACQVVSQIVSEILVPLMGIYLAFCIVGSLVPGMNISAAANCIRSVVNWALGLLMTVFVGLLSLQTIVASGSDNVAAKTAKFLIGSFVPVVGGALSDAFVATQGYVRLLRASIGVFGILAAAAGFLPVFLQTLLWYLTANFTSAAAEMLEIKTVAGMLKSAGTTLGVLLSVILCFALLVIISTTLVLTTSTGV